MDDLPFLHEILGTGNMAPAHVVDMKQSVKTAEVDESTEGREGFHDTFDDVTDLNGGEEFFLILLDLHFQILATVYDALQAATAMEFINDEIIFYTNEGFGILDAHHVRFGERAKTFVLSAEIDLKSTLDDLFKLAQHG